MCSDCRDLLVRCARLDLPPDLTENVSRRARRASHDQKAPFLRLVEQKKGL
ncbi:hypothetical protein [Treponema ruminis]|uniref:Uncharacterized protein n=1 Tax=Treponema ruminis TaxID=744515 RepID=A0A7W8G8W8_9SPIR|nr:hypothetical protein [Treponema ruminis]MBB5225927.1 hypothetical protein [Treponema ruminis]